MTVVKHVYVSVSVCAVDKGGGGGGAVGEESECPLAKKIQRAFFWMSIGPGEYLSGMHLSLEQLSG